MHREGLGVVESPRGLERRDGKMMGDYSPILVKSRGSPVWRMV